ncbi:MAG: site-2 protease family protein [Dehalococcoidales bacterium]|jgi:Zn-dependent protease
MQGESTRVIYALAWYFVFVISVTFHEAAHAWAAKKGGDLTAYTGGQVSLNPWPHIKREPWGMVVLPLISAFAIGWPFGFARTPYDPTWAHQHPRKAAWMAAAGPAANLLLAIFAVIIIKLGIQIGFFAAPYTANIQHIVDATSVRLDGFATFISILFMLNLILVILNLFPLPPLDGSGVISLFMSEDTARKYRKFIANPLFGFIGLILAWYAFSPLFQWVFGRVINIIYWGANYQ